MSDATQSILKHALILGGFENDPNLTKTMTRAQSVIRPEHGPGVQFQHQPPVHSPVPHGFYHGFHYHTGTPVVTMQAYPGSTDSVVIAALSAAFNPTTSPGSTSSAYLPRLGPGGAPDPVTLPVPEAVGPNAGIPTTKQKTTVVTNNPTSNFVVNTDLKGPQNTSGLPGEERNVKWEKRSAIKTAESPFGSIPSLGMLQGLPGQILSLASSFKGLSKQQKERIKSNTSNQMYSMIEYVLTHSTDVGDIETVSLHSRVDANTFANNMVEMLSKCKSHIDLRDCMDELRSNTQLHGKDKLPTVEYKIKNTFGETGLIIDAYGNYKQNVSAEVANAQAAFAQFISQGADQVDILSKFEGQITGTTLTVIRVDFGKLEKGENIYIEGPDITDNTQIKSFGTGANGYVGIYNLTLSSNTLPNTEMVLYKVTPAPEQQDTGGGGGGGGLGGLVGFFNSNMFGEAAKLMGEQIPVLDPKAAGAVMGVLKGIQGNVQQFRGAKFLAIAKQFAGKVGISVR